MRKKLIREWKKVFESDLGYISFELKDTIPSPAVIILTGPMGSGKTTFAKSFIDDGQSMSPSYSILSESRSVLHGDFYRVEKKEDIIHLEMGLYLESKQYFLAEWGEKYIRTIEKEVPEEFLFYQLEIEVNEVSQSDSDQKAVFSRNFYLKQISDI